MRNDNNDAFINRANLMFDFGGHFIPYNTTYASWTLQAWARHSYGMQCYRVKSRGFKIHDYNSYLDTLQADDQQTTQLFAVPMEVFIDRHSEWGMEHCEPKTPDVLNTKTGHQQPGR